MNWYDIIERAVWTSVQSVVAGVVTLPAFTDVEGWEALGISALAALGASLLSVIKTVAQERLAAIDTRGRHEA